MNEILLPHGHELCAKALLEPLCQRLARARRHVYAHPLEAPRMLFLLAELLPACAPMPAAARSISLCIDALQWFAVGLKCEVCSGIRICECNSCASQVATHFRVGAHSLDRECIDARAAICACGASTCLYRLDRMSCFASLGPALLRPCMCTCGGTGLGGNDENQCSDLPVPASQGAPEVQMGCRSDCCSDSEASEGDAEVCRPRVQVRLGVTCREKLADAIAWPRQPTSWMYCASESAREVARRPSAVAM